MDSIPVVLHPPYSIQFGVVVKQDVVISIAIKVPVVPKIWFAQGSRNATVLLVEGEEHHMSALALGNI